MKNPNGFKSGLAALSVIALVMSAQSAFAQGSGGGGSGSGSGSGTPKKRQANFSLSDFNAYMTQFFHLPSTFPWNEPSLPQYSESPGRPDAEHALGPVNPPPADPPDFSCLVLGSDGTTAPASPNLYSNVDCHVRQPPIPIITASSMQFQGTYCEAGDFKFSAYWTGGTGQLQATLGAGFNSEKRPILCSNLLNLSTGSNFSIPLLGGEVEYTCQGGLWRLTKISCSDTGALCPGYVGTIAAKTGQTVPRTFSDAKAGTPGPSATCADFGTPAGWQWIGSTVQTVCNPPNWDYSARDCELVVIPPPPPPPPPRNVTYPNCIGTGTVYADPYLKAGIKACLNGDQTKYFWMMIDGDAAPTVCGDPNLGC